MDVGGWTSDAETWVAPRARLRLPDTVRRLAPFVAVLVALLPILPGEFQPALAAAAPWHIVNTPNSSGGGTRLTGVACTSANNCWAVGYATSFNDVAVILRWNGSSWSHASAPAFANTSSELQAVTCQSASNCWAVGVIHNHASAQMLTEHWNGS